MELLRRLVNVRAGEVRAMLLACAYFFFVLFGYYILRPIRDEMGAAGGVDNLAWLFTGTLIAMIVLQPLFASLVARFSRRRFIAISYRFFALNLVGFFIVLRTLPATSHVWVGRVFFIWAAVFNLFVVSIFWAFMADIFAREQGKRLFGFIGVGGTLGGIAGSLFTTQLVEVLGQRNLLLASAVLLEVAVWCTFALGRTAPARDDALHSPARPDTEPEQAIGGSAFAGFTNVAKSPYLIGIALYMMLFTVLSTFLYFQQAELSTTFFDDRDARTAFFARIDLWVNSLTLLTQAFLTARLIRWLGIGLTLALLPIMTVIGFGALTIVPLMSIFVAFQVLRRAGNYAVAQPTRQVLFTVVPREDRYKAKSFIDTAVYRAGDQFGAWSYRFLSTNLGMGLAAIAGVAIPLAAIWTGIAIWLGRRQAKIVQESGGAAVSAPRPAVATS